MESSGAVAPFARTCQAAHLLGRVCEHVNENASSESADLHFSEASQLSRTLIALISMLHDETSRASDTKRHTLFSARALAYAALSTLYDVHSCIEGDEIESIGGNRGLRIDLQQLAISGLKMVLADVLKLATEIEHFTTQNDTDKVSPFVLYCLHTIASTFAWYVRENGSQEHLTALSKIRRVMEILQAKWRAASKYASLTLFCA